MYLKEPIYLSGSNSRRMKRTSPLRQVANAVFIVTIVAVNYLVFFHEKEAAAPPSAEGSDHTETQPELEPAPIEPASPAPTPEPAAPADGETTVVRNFEGRLHKGDTVIHALMSQGLQRSSIGPILSAMHEVYDFRKAQVGHRFSGKVDGHGRVVAFQYETGPADVYEVHLEGDAYRASRKAVPVDTRMAYVGCTIGTSLFASLTRCGEGPELAAKVTDLFAFDMDFFQEIRQGDVVRLIVEKVYIDGRFLKYGKIHAARYDGKFGALSAFAYRDATGREEYFAREGRALRREFLKTPLKYTRISSGFAQNRLHPTLHKWRRHLAVDYAAPTGAPVQAVASGTVRHVGKKGASGNLVAIEHSGGYTSYYAHLSKFGRIQVGDKVDQKTVIGFVGATGRATGPHLHFALKQGKKWVNPLKVKFTSADPVGPAEKARFEAAVKPLDEELQRIRVTGLPDRQG